VEYENADHSIHFGATLTYPDGGGSFPAVILITGSGLQDRDETIGLHKPFAVIAHYLTQKGIAVLRIDDRGIGKSTGDTKNATSADFAKDVETSLAYLKTRAEIDVEKIGLVGHSEGGMIGPLVASRHPEIAFVVMLAGPGIPIQELMAEQSAATLRTVGISQEAIQAYMPFYRKLSEVIPRSPSAEEARKSAWVEFQKWQNATPKELIAATTGTTDSASAQKFVGHFTDQLYSPWFRYFMQYNPQPTLRELHCPVLALNGEKDVQVIAKSNLEGIRLSLKKNKKTSIQELTGLNHLFQTCMTCGVGEYFTLEETFSPTALALMGNWIKEVVR
jgi:pimeloyl-ACP methyl ester carboxylesterase